MKLTHKFSGRIFREAHLLLLMVFVFSGCAPTISQFSETAYQQAVELKVQSLALVDKMDESYASHAEKAEALLEDLHIALEYAKGRPDNELSTRQWEIMIHPERNLVGGLLARWEEEGTLSPFFLQEVRVVISDAFDTIIGLESGKIKPEEVE